MYILSYFMVNIIDQDLFTSAKQSQASNLMLALGDGQNPFHKL
jgi:hypothetical protein